MTLICSCGGTHWKISKKTITLPDGKVGKDVKVLICTYCQKEAAAFIIFHPMMDEHLKWLPDPSNSHI
jgi:hypothetical protein